MLDTSCPRRALGALIFSIKPPTTLRSNKNWHGVCFRASVLILFGLRPSYLVNPLGDLVATQPPRPQVTPPTTVADGTYSPLPEPPPRLGSVTGKH